MTRTQGRRLVCRDGSIQARIHPLWALIRYPAHNAGNLRDLVFGERESLRDHLSDLRSWFRYGDWRNMVRTLPGERATVGEMTEFDQRLAAMKAAYRLRSAQKAGEAQ